MEGSPLARNHRKNAGVRLMYSDAFASPVTRVLHECASSGADRSAKPPGRTGLSNTIWLRRVRQFSARVGGSVEQATWGYVSPALIGPSDTDPSSRCEVERAGTGAWMARPSVRY